MSKQRSELQQEVAETLVSSKAINFEIVGNVLAKYASRAAVTGDTIGAVINWRMIDICIPPDPFRGGQIGAELAAKLERDK